MYRLASCVLLASGCMHDYTTTVRDIAERRAQLAAGPTEVTTAYGDRRIAVDDVVEVRDPSGARTTIRVAALLADGAPPAESVVVVGRGRRLSTDLGGGLLALGVIAAGSGAVYCAIECPRPANYFVTAALVAGGVYLIGRGIAHSVNKIGRYD